MNAVSSAEFLAAIVELVAHPIFVKDRSYRFVLLNRAFFDMVGFEREQMIGKTDYDFFPKEQADFFRRKDVEMFTSGDPVQIEEEPITDREGNVHILATTKVPYRDAQGNVTHLVGIIKEITELKAAQEALRQANAELERRVAERTAELERAQDELLRKERLAVLGQLAGGLAHQLRNPLAAIQNAVALLRRPDGPSGARQALSIIDEEVRRADRTIRDLLDYAAIRPPRLREVPLATIIEQVLDFEHPPEGVDLRVDADAGAVALADASQLAAALGNVVRNAIEAVEQKQKAVVAIHVDRQGDWVRVVVGDSGDGVPASARASLFDPLVTTKPLGVGLGLSIARSLIENLGGTIRFEDSPLGGAAFVIELPAGQDESER